MVVMSTKTLSIKTKFWISRILSASHIRSMLNYPKLKCWQWQPVVISLAMMID